MKSSIKNNGGGVHRPQRTRSSGSSKIYGGGHMSSCCSSHHGCNQQLHHLEQQATVVALDAAALLRPPTIPISRLAVQCMFCLISLILGFRFTRESSQLLLFAANIVHHHHNVGGGTSSSSSSYIHHYLSSNTFNFSAMKNSKSSGIRSNLAWHISQTLRAAASWAAWAAASWWSNNNYTARAVFLPGCQNSSHYYTCVAAWDFDKAMATSRSSRCHAGL